MEDIKKDQEVEQTVENQQVNQADTKKEAPKGAAIKQKIAVTKNILNRKKSTSPASLRKTATEGIPSISPEVDAVKGIKTSIRKAIKKPKETSEATLPKKQKPEKGTTSPAPLRKIATEDIPSISPEVDTVKETKTSVRKAIKKPKETSEATLPKKQKPEKETTLANEAKVDKKTKSKGKSDSDKKPKDKIKINKKKVKKAEGKVDKLKIKVKKAKKRDVKPGKLKSLKGKLNKAIEKFKSRVKKLKKAKKS